MKKYTWSFTGNESIWRNDIFDTIKECVEDAKRIKREDGRKNNYIFVGECIDFTPHVYAEKVLETAMEDAAENCGEVGEEWIAYEYGKKEELKELEDALTEVLQEWLKKYGYWPSFYSVEDIMEVNIRDCIEEEDDCNG